MVGAMFRIATPSQEAIDAFHENGYAVFPAVFTDAGLAALTAEILSRQQVAEFLAKTAAELANLPKPNRFGERPWSDKGPCAKQLFDAPLVTALLQTVIGAEYHFCHSLFNVHMRGAGGLGFHQDHHHWKHENPVNLAERHKWYIQMLYYLNGFRRGDGSLSIIPGSHLISPLEVTPEQLLTEEYGRRAGHRFKRDHLELPPGSMVFLNARVFHGVASKPLDSPQRYRLQANFIFKEAGPPHLHTQAIPPEWLEDASPHRKKLFQRQPYTPGCWDYETV